MPPPPSLPYEAPPSSRNFSHPNRRRASTISPEQTRHNPPMPRNDSRHMLPFLSSRIFPNSASIPDLRAERQAHGYFDFSYGPPRRPDTSYTAISSFSTPHLTVTALPEFPPPADPPIDTHSGSHTPLRIDAASSKSLAKSPPCSPAKSAVSGKHRGWRRLKIVMKKAFTFKRQKNRSPTYSDYQKGPIEIGSPYGFQHVETHGILPLRTARPGTVFPCDGDKIPSRSMNVGPNDGQYAQQKTGPRHGPRPGNGVIVGTVGRGGLGSLDNDGTAIEEDDDDSAWEDCEATRLFTAYHNRHRKLVKGRLEDRQNGLGPRV